jgi:ABC-type nitrate/sulfonate/bicarbonate transport system substrate-binding protein
MIGRRVEDLIPAIEKREVDAIAAFEPGAYMAVRALGADALALRAPRIYTTTFNLVAGRSFAGSRAADLIKILRAIDRAERFIRAEPQKAQAILRQKLQLDQGFIDWVWPDLDYALSLDQSLLKTLESEARWALREGHANGKKPADYLDYIDSEPLTKALPGAVTLVK